MGKSEQFIFMMHLDHKNTGSMHLPDELQQPKEYLPAEWQTTTRIVA